MPVENTIAITLQDLKTIIHGLKMASLAFVEDDAVDEIEAMISSLPGPEELNGYVTTPDSLKKIQEQIGGIMRLIEVYSKRDQEYKTRYKSRTGLPPRYKVLDWENNKMSSSRDSKNKLVKDIVKLSRAVDDDGLSVFSMDLLSCAKEMRDNNSLPIEKLYDATKDFVKSARFINAGLRKEAQALTDIDISMGDVTEGFGQIGAWFDTVLNSIWEKQDYLSKNPKTSGFMNQLKSIWQQVAQLKENTDAQTSKIVEITSQMEQSMEELIPQSVSHQGKTYEIEYIDDTTPGEEGWQTAVVNIDGQMYTVQRGADGKNVVGPAVESAQAPEVSQEQEQAQEQEQEQANISTQQGQQSQQETGVSETTSTGEEPRLEMLDRNQLITMIQTAVPKVWQEGFNGKAVAQLSDKEMRQALKDNIGEKSLPQYVKQVYDKAASRVFNLKAYSVIK